MPNRRKERPPLPYFERPPVVETVLGVEFGPLRGWDVRHFGLLWSRIRDRFARLETKPALARSGAADGAAFNLVLEKLEDPASSIRCWFIDEDQTRLLQVQQDRFIHNWRKVSGDERYPRYDQDVRPRFLDELQEFRAFLEDSDIQPPKWRRCEVTYINHLEMGREWESLADLPEILPAFRSGALAGRELSLPESVNIRWRHALEDGGGWLTFILHSATRNRDQKKVLQYQISAQVEVEEDTGADAVAEALDRGRYAVVQSFDTSTSSTMHSLWGRKERPQ